MPGSVNAIVSTKTFWNATWDQAMFFAKSTLKAMIISNFVKSGELYLGQRKMPLILELRATWP
jgi:hypothetical protein